MPESLSTGFPPTIEFDGTPACQTTVDARSPGDVELTTVPGVTAQPGAACDIPGYVIQAEIARGSMGRVLAARDLTLDREVAIKTLLPGSSAIRFITEARITARLPHPGIPPVHALGMLPDGSHFLAMKLVRGETLETLLARRQSPREELSTWIHVFEQIAQAVGFAHAQGIIHRDLKPSNVMVGAFGEVQVMDWGLAKDTRGGGAADEAPEGPSGSVVERGSDGADLTESGTIMGTPSYMAPEQARGETVDARADVFALGSILATILTSRPAFTGSSAIDVVSRAAAGDVSDVHARIDASGADAELIALAKRCLSADAGDRPADARAVAADAAAYRGGVEARLRQAETDRERAVVRAAEQRKRKRLAQWAGGLIAGVLLAGIAGTSVGLRRASRSATAERAARLFAQGETERAIAAAGKERDAKLLADAQKQRAEAAVVHEKAARAQAEQEKSVALAVRNFLQNNLLRQASPWEQANRTTSAGATGAPQGDSLTVRELLEISSREFSPKTIGQKFPDQPVVQAEILETIGETYEGLGEQERAAEFVKAAHQIREQHFGKWHPATLSSLTNLAFVHLAALQHADAVRSFLTVVERVEQLLQNLPEPGEAGAAARERHPGVIALNGVLDKFDQRLDPRRFTLPVVSIGLGDGAVLILQVSQSIPRMHRLAQVCRAQFGDADRRTILFQFLVGSSYSGLGQVQKGCEIFERVYADASRILPPDDGKLIGLRQVLAYTYDSLEIKPKERVRLLEEALQSQQRILGTSHPGTLVTLVSVASAYGKVGRHAEAIALHEQARDIRAKLHGAEHEATLSSMVDLAEQYGSAGKTVESIAQFERVMAVQIRKLGPEHRETLTTMNNLGVAYDRAGRTPEAIAILERVREVRMKTPGPEHADTLTTTYNLALAYADAGRLAEAIALLESVREADSRTLAPGHPNALSTLRELGAVYRQAGDHPRAIATLAQVRDALVQAHGVEHSSTLDAMEAVASSLIRAGKVSEGVATLVEWGRIQAKTSGGDPLSILNNKGVRYYSAGKIPEAIALFEHVRDGRIETLGAEHKDTLITLGNLATSYRRGGRLPEAIATLEQIRDVRVKLHGDERPEALAAMYSLAMACQDAGRHADAIALLEQAHRARLKLGADHPEALVTLNNLAMAYRSAGRLPEALPLFERMAQAILSQSVRHPVSDALLGNAIETLEATGDLEKAEAWHRGGLSLLKESQGAESPAYSGRLGGLCQNLLRQKKWVEAEAALRECVPLRQKLQPAAWTTFSAQSMLGEALLGQGKHSEAEPNLVAGSEGLLANEAAAAPRDVARSLLRLVELYEATRQPEEIEKRHITVESRLLLRAIELGGKGLVATPDNRTDREVQTASTALVPGVEVRGVVLANLPSLDPRALAELPGIDRVSHVNLWAVPLEAGHLQSLPDMPKLTFLNLGKTGLEGDALAPLERFGELRELHLQHLAGAGELAVLRRLTHLRVLSLWISSLSDEGLRTVLALPNLEELNVAGTQISDAGFPETLPPLRQLDLSNTRTTDAVAERIGRLTTLRALDVRGTDMTSDGVARLRRMLPTCAVQSRFPPP